jgi:ubiquinone/menaquinone biosynthesis C-methylase UbiE
MSMTNGQSRSRRRVPIRLDPRCGIGNTTLLWVLAFPSAEVVAVDIAARWLRYRHARVEANQCAIHLVQLNAEDVPRAR